MTVHVSEITGVKDNSRIMCPSEDLSIADDYQERSMPKE